MHVQHSAVRFLPRGSVPTAVDGSTGLQWLQLLFARLLVAAVLPPGLTQSAQRHACSSSRSSSHIAARLFPIQCKPVLFKVSQLL